jgi:hypothetical protein
MLYNLNNLVQRHENLEQLSRQVTREEINKVVAQMPLDKSPDPDGFNGLFFKKCWHIIREDVYELCNDFFSGSLSLEAKTPPSSH